MQPAQWTTPEHLLAHFEHSVSGRAVSVYPGSTVVGGDAVLSEFQGEAFLPTACHGSTDSIRHAEANNRLLHRSADDVANAAETFLFHKWHDGLSQELVVNQMHLKSFQNADRFRPR